jgi:hypothetical protein
MGRQDSKAADIIVNIGNFPIQLEISDQGFADMVRERYAAFIDAPPAMPRGRLEVEVSDPASPATDEDVSVSCSNGCWSIQRGDFRAEWRPAERCGRVRQSRNVYGFDSVLRIIHSLELAREGAFLLHSASVIRNGGAFLFSGLSGAGKTTMARLAPADCVLLSDEISYVRRGAGSYMAWGTPFSGELARPGENVQAPIRGLYLLKHSDVNRVEPVSRSEALGRLLRNVLFFANDAGLVGSVFETVSDFVRRVPVYRLLFRPDPSVWELVK